MSKPATLHCEIWEDQNTLKVYLGGVLIANVHEGPDGPTIYPIFGSNHCWTFNEMDIIQDNWNQMQEMRVPAEKCPYCAGEYPCPECR